MEILSTIVISLLSGAIVFFFGQKAIKAKERDDEKKKLNKLLFHLLIIRRMATDRLNFNDSVSLYFEELIKQIQIKFKLSDDEINSPEAKEMIDMSKSVLKKRYYNYCFSIRNVKLDKVLMGYDEKFYIYPMKSYYENRKNISVLNKIRTLYITRKYNSMYNHIISKFNILFYNIPNEYYLLDILKLFNNFSVGKISHESVLNASLNNYRCQRFLLYTTEVISIDDENVEKIQLQSNISLKEFVKIITQINSNDGQVNKFPRSS